MINFKDEIRFVLPIVMHFFHLPEISIDIGFPATVSAQTSFPKTASV